MALDPVPRPPFQVSLAAVAVFDFWDHFAFQPWLTLCVPGKAKVSVHPDSAAPLLVRVIAP
ncbi:hypothetical protein GCM10010353_43450 [Streptomyces chryseus]|nr:hypothetical protein GCM10010353_43450 [Streptomyces chryseus]